MWVACVHTVFARKMATPFKMIDFSNVDMSWTKCHTIPYHSIPCYCEYTCKYN